MGQRVKMIFLIGTLSVLSGFLVVPPLAYATFYQPGATLDPSCLPSDPTCGVATTTYSSGVTYNNGNVTNTGLLSLTPQFGPTLTGALAIATSTTGTDFSITGSGSAITFNLPTASASNRGLLSAADWATFSAKQGALSFMYPIVNSAGTVSLAFGTTTSNTWSGLQQFNGNASTTEFTSVGNTYLATSGGNVGIGTTTPGTLLTVAGNMSITGTQTLFMGSRYGSYTAFGDSISTGADATPQTIDGYPYLIAAQLGLTVNMKAVSSETAADQEDNIYETIVPSTGNPLYTYMIGTNDAGVYPGVDGPAKYAEENDRLIQEAEDAWLSIPDANKIRGQAATTTGSWTNSSYYGGAVGVNSTTNGSTLTFNTGPGTVVYLAYTMLDGNAGTFSVSIDGASYGTYTNAGYDGTTINTTHLHRTYGSALARFPGLTPGQHTVVVTVTSATGAGNQVMVDWVGTNAGFNTINGPTLVMGGVPRSLQGAPGALTDAVAYRYSGYTMHNVSDLSGDGLRVSYADTTDAINPATDFVGNTTDGIHPTNLGHVHLAQAFMVAINSIPVSSYAANGSIVSFPVVTSPIVYGGSYATSTLTLSGTQSIFPSNAYVLLNPLGQGNVGIGTTSPFVTLSVAGSGYFGGSLGINGFGSFQQNGMTILQASSTLNTVAIGTGINASSTGVRDLIVGVGAGAGLTSGFDNVLIGYQTGQSLTNVIGTVAIGNGALASATSYGGGDVAIGYDALNLATSSISQDTAIGYATLSNFLGNTNPNGGGNTAVGYETLSADTTGLSNTAVGALALVHDTTGSNNTAIGDGPLNSNTTGSSNTAIGDDWTLANNTTGSYNVAIGGFGGGNGPLQYNVSGNYNFAEGIRAASLTTGSLNTAIGAYALYANTTGSNNIAIGGNNGTFWAAPLYDNSSATNTVAIGNGAAAGNNTVYNNQGGVYLGYNAGMDAATNSNYNTFLGYQAGYNDTGGTDNILIGPTLNTGGGNLSTGSSNIGIGYNIIFPSATANNQLNIGNFIFGTSLEATSSSTSLPSGTITGNLGIGTTTPYSRLTLWGLDTAGATAALTIANSASTTEFQVFDNGAATLAGTLTQNSDQRLKKNVESLDASTSLQDILGLNPVSFNWIDPTEGQTQQIGFIAQQVQQIFPQLVATTSATALTPGGTLSLNYIGLIAPAIESIKALATEVDGFASLVTTSVLDATTVNTHVLCVKTSAGSNVCITGDQLKVLLNQSGQNSVLVAPPPAPTTPVPSSSTASASTTDSESDSSDTDASGTSGSDVSGDTDNASGTSAETDTGASSVTVSDSSASADTDSDDTDSSIAPDTSTPTVSDSSTDDSTDSATTPSS